LVQVLCQHTNWGDLRRLKTLAWMMVGLIHSGCTSLSAWAPYVVSRAQSAQSTVRRFRRWLDNDQIDVGSLSGPLMAQALAEWGEQALSIALDTSMLWNTYGDFSKRMSLFRMLVPDGSKCRTWAMQDGAPSVLQHADSP